MQISWNGLGSFVIKGKPVQGEVSLVTDPYQNSTGLRFPKTLSAELIIQSCDSDNTNNINVIEGTEHKKPFLVHHTGEYEIHGIFVTGVNAPLKDGTPQSIYRIEIEDISVGFLGSLDRDLTNKEMEYLGNIDILIIPAGGGSVLDAKTAAELTSKIEPRLVIPSYVYVSGLNEKLDSADVFVKEVGAEKEDMNKLKITANNLPQEEIKIVVLSRS